MCDRHSVRLGSSSLVLVMVRSARFLVNTSDVLARTILRVEETAV